MGIFEQVVIPVDVFSFAHLTENKKKIILDLECDFRTNDCTFALLKFGDSDNIESVSEVAAVLVTRGWGVCMSEEGFIVDISSKWDA